MGEPLQVLVETWGLVAWQDVIYLVSADRDGEPDAWFRGLPVTTDTTIHDEAMLLASGQSPILAIHGTSWRETFAPDIRGVVHTYMAVLDCPTLPFLRWGRAAVPLTREAINNAGKPVPHGPAEAPRHIKLSDVATHGVRHLAYLYDSNAGVRDMFDRAGWWPEALHGIRRELARLYLPGQVPARNDDGLRAAA